MAKEPQADGSPQERRAAENRPVCGLVMPISAIDSCSEQHWLDVRAILTDAIDEAGFEARLVSEGDDVGIIQKRFVQNLYDNPMLVCDVSGKNPNVMFELGMRLAFDKPTVIVKDDKTDYSFDTSPIEHVEYPRDLRFAKIVTFRAALTDKIRATYETATRDPNYTTFLKHFKFTVPKLETEELPKGEYIIEQLVELKQLVTRLVRREIGRGHRDEILSGQTVRKFVEHLVDQVVLQRVRLSAAGEPAIAGAYEPDIGGVYEPDIGGVYEEVKKVLEERTEFQVPPDRLREIVFRRVIELHIAGAASQMAAALVTPQGEAAH